MRHILAVVVVALAAAFAPTPASAQGPLPPAVPITAAQVGALDATLSLMIVAEGDHPTNAQLVAAETQCGSLAAGDRLLARFASLCAAELRATRAGTETLTCDGSRACRRVFVRIRTAIRHTITAARRWNRLLPVALADARCVRALDLSGGELRSLRRLGFAYRMLSAAVKNRSERQRALAQRRFEQAGQPASAALVRRRLRASCIPVA